MKLLDGFELHRGWGKSSALTLADFADISWAQSTVRVFGREYLTPRLTAWYGERGYTYSGAHNVPQPMPPLLESLRCTLPVKFNSVLLNMYRDGSDSVAWHSDDEPELGEQPTIASISLGASRKFSIRHKATRERTDILLSHGDLLIMSGRSQLDYEHCVPKAFRTIEPRINLTFRYIY